MKDGEFWIKDMQFSVREIPPKPSIPYWHMIVHAGLMIRGKDYYCADIFKADLPWYKKLKIFRKAKETLLNKQRGLWKK